MNTTAERAVPEKPLATQILKVNHAGEHGAVNIYRGQAFICRWRAPELISQLLEFKTHEEGHRAHFAKHLAIRSVRRCRSYHFCGLGGLVLGIITGLFGRSAVAATTVAVEKVVLRHLEHQIIQLGPTDPEACEVVKKIVEEEKVHHDSAELELQQGPFWPRILIPIVAGSTELVIWLGMKL
jgi:ubiquinone biosynthesis monooxygenase Coq7